MKLATYFETTDDKQRDLARRCSIHEGRMSELKRGGWPSSVEQALAIARETGFLVLPNDFLPDGALPRRAARAKSPSRKKATK